MATLTVDGALAARLEVAATRLGTSPDRLAGEALAAYLEDIDDYAAGVAALAEASPENCISLASLKAELGLDD